MMNHISVNAWRMVMFYEHNSSNRMMAACAICQDEIEMRWPGGLMAGVGRERLTGFSGALHPTYANLALKITTTALVQLNQNYRETSSHG